MFSTFLANDSLRNTGLPLSLSAKSSFDHLASEITCSCRTASAPFLSVDVGLETGSYLYKMAAAIFPHPITAGFVSRLSADSLHAARALK